MIDLIAQHFDGNQRPQINCLDHGFVALVDVMPRVSYDDKVQTADHAIVQAARVSYGAGTKKLNEDRGLLRYLMRHRHTTPLEMVEFKFHCKMPIFIARQWIRHRTANVNEISGRYSVMKSEFYVPEEANVRMQSAKNKQCSEGQLSSSAAQKVGTGIQDFCDHAYETYEGFMDQGVGREQARMVLPLGLYTEWYWKIDLHNLLHFLALRCDAHAQQEIQVYGEAMLKLIEPIVPLTIEAWNDYHPMRGAVLLTKLEVEALNKQLADQNISVPVLDSDNKREGVEWKEKAEALGLKL